MKMVGITPCYRITLENGSYGVETYINADSKIQITFEDGNTLIGYIECVEYGTYSDENDTLVIRGENGELYILLENRIKPGSQNARTPPLDEKRRFWTRGKSLSFCRRG